MTEIEKLRKEQMILMSPQRKDEKLIKMYEILPEGIEEIDKTETEGFNEKKFGESKQRVETTEIINQIIKEIESLEISEKKKENITQQIIKLKNKLSKRLLPVKIIEGSISEGDSILDEDLNIAGFLLSDSFEMQSDTLESEKWMSLQSYYKALPQRNPFRQYSQVTEVLWVQKMDWLNYSASLAWTKSKVSYQDSLIDFIQNQNEISLMSSVDFNPLKNSEIRFDIELEKYFQKVKLDSRYTWKSQLLEVYLNPFMSYSQFNVMENIQFNKYMLDLQNMGALGILGSDFGIKMGSFNMDFGVEKEGGVRPESEVLSDLLSQNTWECRKANCIEFKTEKQKIKIETQRIKAEEQKMMLARENKARSGATLEGLENRKKDLIDALRNDLNINEKDLFDMSDLKSVEELPNVIEQEDKLDAKKNERDKLGAVNLRADEETEQYKGTIKKMEKDREDLISAISKLRSSISELNQKGRERLIEAFDKVNRKFNEVYTKLFNGGNAKLELVDADDPLEAGLELLVSPPGKRLQSITLLSGGEQALTALSLIFAVFLTNPSPICVLDEVDAPLDDANVSRFCNLLDELTKITSTRFVIVTHHALTMSKMDRLYGVTMPEKGISQLVAVDLQKAESMVA